MRELITHIEDRNISSMPATKLQKLMHMYDMNNDGLISYKEFTQLVSITLKREPKMLIYIIL